MGHNVELSILGRKPENVTKEEYIEWIYYGLGINSSMSPNNPLIGKEFNLRETNFDVKCQTTEKETLF